MKSLCLLSLLVFGSFQAIAEEPYRILAFGDSNTWGWVPNGGGTRYSDDERWAGVLEGELGAGFAVNCDGLVARRSTLDGLTAGLVDGSFLNGAKTLPAAIARHAPLDLVILFLGTNDVQAGAGRTAHEVAAALGELIIRARQSEKLLYASYPAPEVWVVVPPALGDLSKSSLKGLFGVGYETSQHFSEAFESLAASHSVVLIDSAKVLFDGIGEDGIHLNKAGHEQLGKALSREIHERGIK